MANPHGLAPTHWARGMSEAQCLATYRAKRSELVSALLSDRSFADRTAQLRRECAIEACFLRRLSGL